MPSSRPVWLPLPKSSPPHAEHLHQPYLVFLALLLAAPSPPSHIPQLTADAGLSNPALGHFPTQGLMMALSAWLFKFSNLTFGRLFYVAPSSWGGLHCVSLSPLPAASAHTSSLPTRHAILVPTCFHTLAALTSSPTRATKVRQHCLPSPQPPTLPDPQQGHWIWPSPH